MDVVSRGSVVQVVGTRHAVQLAYEDPVKEQLVIDGMFVFSENCCPGRRQHRGE